MAIRRILTAAALVLASGGAGAAGSCGHDVCFGAVAVGERGWAARASGVRTAPQAHARADTACNGNCPVIEVFHSGCGVIAMARRQTFAGFGETRELAEAEAHALCEANTGAASCRTRVWACSE